MGGGGVAGNFESFVRNLEGFSWCCYVHRAFFKNSSVWGGGINKKGPYYTDCREMIDGC